MRRLTIQQRVTLELDGPAEDQVDSIACRVVSVNGPVASLAPPGAIEPRVQDRLNPGSLGFMVFEHRGLPIGLRGVARAAAEAPELEFVVIDGIQVAERRSAARLPLIAPLRATPLDGEGNAGPEVATVTSNLSLGGALITRRPGLGDGPRWRVELTLRGEPAPVRCEALLARITPTHIGVRFDRMEEPDRIRLAGALADFQRLLPANSRP